MMKIAVCDDSREDRGALKALLETYGRDFEIREYGSGEELYMDMGYVKTSIVGKSKLLDFSTNADYYGIPLILLFFTFMLYSVF